MFPNKIRWIHKDNIIVQQHQIATILIVVLHKLEHHKDLMLVN